MSAKMGGDGGRHSAPGGEPSSVKRSASISSMASSGRSASSASPRRSSPQRAVSSRLGGLLRAGPKTPPAHKAPFCVPSIAWQQAGGFYSDAELPDGNVEYCPNRKNPAHHCTNYCFERFAPLSKQERFLAAAGAATSKGSWGRQHWGVLSVVALDFIWSVDCLAVGHCDRSASR